MSGDSKGVAYGPEGNGADVNPPAVTLPAELSSAYDHRIRLFEASHTVSDLTSQGD
jgi:hypothetical protein